jgi:crotonobetainyl-CoA:carnitine CoA-transferase CaiB-like acyl-CoA transferase
VDDLLKDFRVLELAGVLAGPAVGQFLAELGAKVIKVENLLTDGDVTRRWRSPGESADNDISAYFSTMNWGKESIAVDLSQPEGRKIIHGLIEKADIVISSYKKGDDEKLEMDEATIRRLNPQIIYAHVSGYGRDNPKVAYDAVLQAESGLMSMNGTPESGPLKVPIPMVDIMAAHQLKQGVLAAIIRRMQTGKGSSVSISLMDAAVVSLSNQGLTYLYTGAIPQLQGSLHPTIAPYGETFTTSDDRCIILAIGTDKQFAAFCRIIGLPDMTKDQRFSTNVLRLANRTELDKLLVEQVKKSDSRFLLSEAEKENIPMGLVRNAGEALESHPDLVYEQSGLHGLRQTIFTKDGRALLPPPHAGEHTSAILTVMDYTAEEQDNLREKKIIP